MMLVAVAAMGFACAQETTEVAPEKQTKTITVNCDITRVAFNDDNSALTWSEGDTIGAFTDAEDVNVVSSAYPEAFTLEVSADATEVFAYYPYYSGNSEKAATAMSIGLKGTITQSEAGKITTLGAIPMVAVGDIYGNTVDLLFEPYACVLAYNVYGGESSTEKVTSIKFTGDKKSSGYDYEFDLTVCDVAEYTPANGYTQVNLTVNAQFVPNGTKPAGVSANAVFMPVAKQVYGAGSTIVVTTTEDTYTFTATGDINCNQGYATLNLNLAKAEKASDNIVEVDIADGDYILAVKSGSSYYAVAGTNNVSSNRMDQVEITSIFDTENIETNDVTLIWTITKTTNGYYFEYDSKYLYGSSSSNQGKIGNSTDNVITLADNGDGTYKVMSSVAGAGRALGQNVESKGFAFYKDSTLEDAAAYPSNFYIVPVSFVATPRIEVAKNAVSLGSGAAEGTVNVTLEYVTADEVDVESSASWLEATLEDSTLSFSAEANSGAERSATVTLTAGDATATITFTQAAYVEVNPDAVKTYTFTITKEDFSTTSYAANNNTKTSVAEASDGSKIEVEWTSYQVMQQNSTMQWQKNKGYIYNETDLGTIDSIDVVSTAGTFTTYKGSASQPTSNGEGGYFQIKETGNVTGKVDSITITFTK